MQPAAIDKKEPLKTGVIMYEKNRGIGNESNRWCYIGLSYQEVHRRGRLLERRAHLHTLVESPQGRKEAQTLVSPLLKRTEKEEERRVAGMVAKPGPRCPDR